MTAANGKKNGKIEWDKNIDLDVFYETAKKEIQKLLPPENKKEYARLGYWVILVIQATNGLRISEAVDGFKKWLKEGDRFPSVKVRKKRNVEEYVTIKIPKIVKDEYRGFLEDYMFIDESKIVNRVKKFASVNGINTHSLRYAWITKKLKEGANPAIVAKAVRHSSVNMIMRYVQKMKADELRLNDDY